MSDSKESQTQKVITAVTAYWIVSIGLVFTNKALLSSSVSIPAPLFITWYQCVVTAVVCWVLGFIGKTSAEGSYFKQFPEATWNSSTAIAVLPLSFMFVGMVTFNNLCLQYVEVTFYNVARSLTMVCNMIFTYLILRERTSFRAIMCVGVVILGFYLGVEGEVNFSLIGTVFGIMSSIFVSLNSIFTKSVLPKVKNDKWTLTFYNNVNATLMFPVLIYLMHEEQILLKNTEILISGEFWALMTVGGIGGTLIGLATVAQIQATSPLTHNISGTAKAAAQTVLAFYIWNNPATFMGCLGIAVVLGGSLLYAFVKRLEMQAARAAKDQQQKEIERVPLQTLEEGERR